MHKQTENSPYRFTHVPKKGNDSVGHKRVLDESMLSDEQREVFEKVCRWYGKHMSGGLLTLGGYAGSGKSTLVSLLAGRYKRQPVGFSAFTGKATGVLRRKLQDANSQYPNHTISTLHSLLYIPVVDEHTGRVTGWRQRKKPELDLIVVDEASMVDERLYDALHQYDIPILAVGDHGQLPPVYGKFNLMEDPDLRLETIHRQAQGSPILALSDEVRRKGFIPHNHSHNTPTREVQIVGMSQLEMVVSQLFGQKATYNDVAILTNTNRERVALNSMARRAAWDIAFKDELQVGDQVICLKNIAHTIFNGMRGVVVQLSQRRETKLHYYGQVLFEDDELMVEGLISKVQFNREATIRDFDEYEDAADYRVRDWESIGMLFDFGYALTVHKSQGSQFTYVIVVDKPTGHMDPETKKRALYTAITRCSKYLVVVR